MKAEFESSPLWERTLAQRDDAMEWARSRLWDLPVGWLEREVQEWLAQRIEISRGKAAAPLSKRAAPVPGFGSRP